MSDNEGNGFTGGTGLPGGPMEPSAETDQAGKPNAGSGSPTLEDVANQSNHAAFEAYVGATGTGGQRGDTVNAEREDGGYALREQVETLTRQLKGKSLHQVLEMFAKFTTKSMPQFLNAQIAKVTIVFVYGVFFLKMKALAKADNISWGEWAAKHLAVRPKTRERYMRLASTPGLELHAHLGIEALVEVSGVIKPLLTNGELDKEDPLTDLLRKKTDLNLDDPHLPLEDFRRGVNALVVERKLANKKIHLNMKQVMAFLAVAGDFTSADIAVMADREQSRREAKEQGKEIDSFPSAEEYVNTVIASNGSREGLEPHKLGPAEKRVQAFIGTAKKLESTIERIAKDENVAADLDRETVRSLIKALKDLDKLIG
jgi:hypothetical protein